MQYARRPCGALAAALLVLLPCRSALAHAETLSTFDAAHGENAAWSEEATLFASDGGRGPGGEFFGWSGAYAAGTAVIGAWGDSSETSGAHGSAYVFTRDEGTWTEAVKLLASDGATFDAFGVDVALDGDTTVVGAPCHPALGCDVPGHPGAAYVFVGSGDAWAEQAKLVPSDGVVMDQFAYSIAIEGDTILVGARNATVEGNPSQGAAYVFVRSGETWAEHAKLVADDGASLDGFGASVALSGDTALVGLACAGGGGCDHPESAAGAAYVFVRTGAMWTQQAKLVPSDGAAGDLFGASVALSGDTVLVGASFASVDGNLQQGAAYVYERLDDQWTEQAKLVASDGVFAASFGEPVTVLGDMAVIGAPRDGKGVGAAYVFTRTDDVWTEGAKLVAEDESIGRVHGPVALTDDVLLLGAPGTFVDTVNAGAVLVYSARRVPGGEDSGTSSETGDTATGDSGTETGNGTSTQGSATASTGGTSDTSGESGASSGDTSGADDGGGATEEGCGCRSSTHPHLFGMLIVVFAASSVRRSRRS